MDSLLSAAEGDGLIAQYGREAVKKSLDKILVQVRSDWRGGGPAATSEEVLARASSLLELEFSPPLQGVINATGVVLHTNLGRAVLRRRDLEDAARLFSGYVDLELDIGEGARNNRDDRLESAIRDLLGTDYGAILVNNNAAAMLLALKTLADGREGVVSRGELVEIGGGFRIPEIMESSGAIMREVGTTNRTRIEDYIHATSKKTALYLKVHPSNYRVFGFSEQASVEEVVALGRRKKLPVLYDLGSGLLLDEGILDLGGEPGVKSALLAGPDAICFSTDKLVGSCQGGILLVAPRLRARFKKSPLLRALRADKLAYFFLGRTVELYRRGRWKEIPALSALAEPVPKLESKARWLLKEIERAAPGFYEIGISLRGGLVGGGTAPVFSLGSPALCVRPRSGSESALDLYMRSPPTPVLGVCEDGFLHLHLRTIFDAQRRLVVKKLLDFAGR